MSFVAHINSDSGFSTLSLLPPAEINTLCCTSRGLQARSTTVLYRRVELMSCILRHSHRTQRTCDVCSRSQRSFCRTILSRPDLALLVRELEWTLEFSPDSTNQQIHHPGAHPANPIRSIANSVGKFISGRTPFRRNDFEDVWEAFSAMTEVVSVGLEVCDNVVTGRVPPWSPFDAVPASLFPKAHTIALRGVCSSKFASSILTNPSRIQHLTIDHLYSRKNSNRESNAPFLGWKTLVDDALPHLLSLSYLSSVGNRGFTSAPDGINEWQREAMSELASAIAESRKTLQALTIVDLRYPDKQTGSDSSGAPVTLAQSLFDELVLPE